jgi:hypothetical protein
MYVCLGITKIYMYVCICIYVYMCTCICIYMFVFIYTHKYAYIHTHTHTHTHTHIGLHTWLLNVMEGTTSIFISIHAAIITTTRISMIARCSPPFDGTTIPPPRIGFREL